jgi:nitrogen fixation protein FixH
LVVGLLTLQVAMGFAAVTLAGGDASFAVVPGYHEQALHWDEARAAARNSASLGWRDHIHAAEQADVFGRRQLTVELQDRAGVPLTAANVKAVVFHHARANEVQNVSFAEISNGRYEAELLMRQTGLWEIRLDASRGGDRLIATRQIDVVQKGVQ